MIQMNTMLAAGSTMNTLNTLGKMRGEMKSETGVLRAEIMADKARSVNTTAKEKELSSLQDKMGDIYKKISTLSKTVTDASQKRRGRSEEGTGR